MSKTVTRYGFTNGPRSDVSLPERFWEKVRKQEGDKCWEWTSALSVDGGYGMFYVSAEKPTEKAHRVAWQLEHGEIPAKMCVCHHCDNPKCVRQSHLFLGTHMDNNHDMVRKERHGRMRFTGEQVRKIRALYERRKSKRKRAAAGELTVQRIADWMGVSKATIAHIVTGRNWSTV